MKLEKLYAFFELEINRIRSMSLKEYFKNYLILPVLFLLFYLVLGKGVGSLTQNFNYSHFLAPGMLGFFVFLAGFSIGYTSLKDTRGHLKELLTLPIDRKTILFGSMVQNISSASPRYLILLLTLIISGAKINSLIGLFLSIPFFMIAFLFSFSFGSILSLLTENNLYLLLSWPIAFLTSAFYPIENSPVFLRNIVLLNPVNYIVRGIRRLLTSDLSFNLVYDFLIVSFITLILIIIEEKIFENYEV